MTTITRRSAASLITVVSISFVVSGCAKKGDATSATTVTPAQAIGPDNIAVARTDTLRSGPPISGTLVAERDARIRAELSGAVRQTYVESGQRVDAGTVLARIDDSAVRDGVTSAKSALTQVTVAGEQAARELQRAKTLFAAGAIAEREVEAAERGNLIAQAAVADVKARLSTAEKGMRNTVVRAPFAGIVSEKSVSPGDIVSPGTALFTVIDPRSLRLEASVPTSALGDVRIGAPVSFTVNGFADRVLQGRITRVSPTVDAQTKQVRLMASVPNAKGSLVAGLFVEGRVESEKRIGVMVPEEAIDQTAIRPYVVRLKGGKVEKVDVQLGVRDEAASAFEVRSGIVAGDTLLLGAARGITLGSSVVVSTPIDAAANVAPPAAVSAPIKKN